MMNASLLENQLDHTSLCPDELAYAHAVAAELHDVAIGQPFDRDDPTADPDEPYPTPASIVRDVITTWVANTGGVHVWRQQCGVTDQCYQRLSPLIDDKNLTSYRTAPIVVEYDLWQLAEIDNPGFNACARTSHTTSIHSQLDDYGTRIAEVIQSTNWATIGCRSIPQGLAVPIRAVASRYSTTHPDRHDQITYPFWAYARNVVGPLALCDHIPTTTGQEGT